VAVVGDGQTPGLTQIRSRPLQRRTVGNSHFGPEHGCVVSTSRSTPAQNQAVSWSYALRLVFDTAALRQMRIAAAPVLFIDAGTLRE